MTLKDNEHIGIIISDFINSDIDDICRIEQENFTDPWSKTIFLSVFINPDTDLITAKNEEGKLLGYACTYKTDVISIDNVSVDKSMQRKGIGQTIISYLIKKYKDMDLTLEVRESNLPAQALYEKLGFERVGFRKRYYQNPAEGAIIMTRFCDNCNNIIKE